MRSSRPMTTIFAIGISAAACPGDQDARDPGLSTGSTTTAVDPSTPTDATSTASSTEGSPDPTTEGSGDPPDTTGGAAGTTGTTGTTSTTEASTGTTAGSETTSDNDTSGSTGVTAPPDATTLQLEILPIKQFAFTWPAATGATYYQLHERLAEADPFVQVGEDIIGTSTTLFVPLHFRSSASYRILACNDGGCTESAPVDVVGSLASAVGYFKASNSKAGFYFGESIALSADGNVMVVGAPKEDGASTGVNGDADDLSAANAGAAYVFVAQNGAWTQQAYIKASNTGGGDHFGYSVALSADGDTLAVGALFEDGSANGVNGSQNDGTSDSGAVYLFKRNGGSWLQQAYIKASNTRPGAMFGLSVSLAGDGKTLAVGTENESSAATGINGNQASASAPNAGAAYVFVATNGGWSQQAYVKASNTDAGDYFGHYLALSHDGDTLAASALHEDSNATGIGGIQSDNSASKAGAVYMFARAGSTWTQQAYVKASNTASADEFGGQLDLSADGNTLAVGAQYENSAATGIDGNQADNSVPGAGAAYIFVRANNSWSQQAYIKASNTGATDLFGYGVALSDDGDVLAASAVYEDSASVGVNGDSANNGAVDSGAIYVFVRDMNTWSQRAYVKAPNTGGGSRLADSLALSADGGTLAAGTNYETSAAQGIGGNQADKSASFAGVAYVY